MNMKTHDLLGVRIDDLDDFELEQKLETWLRESIVRVIVTPNPEFLLLASKDLWFRSLLNKSDLSLPDGVGLRFAIAALTNNRLTNRHTGVDLVYILASLSNKLHRRVLLLGGLPSSSVETKNNLKKLYPTLEIESMDPGYIRNESGSVTIPEILITQIQFYKPDVLLVALGQGKQERFIDQIRSYLPALQIAVGVGGSFDTISGTIPRAPIIMRKIGLEWLWRVVVEPKRIRRILNAIIVFPAKIVWGTLKQHKFLRACRNVFPEIYHQLKGL